MQDEQTFVCESNDAQVCHSNAKTVRIHTGASCMLEAWLALTIGLEVSKAILFRGSYRWLALTMLRVTRARSVKNITNGNKKKVAEHKCATDSLL